jgi:hypothetical protein
VRTPQQIKALVTSQLRCVEVERVGKPEVGSYDERRTQAGAMTGIVLLVLFIA